MKGIRNGSVENKRITFLDTPQKRKTEYVPNSSFMSPGGVLYSPNPPWVPQKQRRRAIKQG
jgi:hypothetical protein